MSVRSVVTMGIAAALAAALAVRVGAHDRITTSVTWAREIAPIIQARCASCHMEGGRAPMPLATYEDARPWARAIRLQVLTRRMPRWSVARGYGDFANDPSLSPFEIQLIVAWADGGAPKTLPENPSRARPPAPVLTRPAAPFVAPAAVERPVACGDSVAAAGELLGLRPSLDKGGSMRVVARLPDGSHEILGWFRDFDPAFSPIYWLRRPLTLPAGARISTETADSATCGVTLQLGR